MRVQAPNGRFYDPEKSAVIGERVTPDGKTQRLQRSVVGAYFFFETPSKSMRSAVTPATYDEALEWAKKYLTKEIINTCMDWSSEERCYLDIVITDFNRSRLEMIAKKEGLSLSKCLSLISKQYYKSGCDIS